MPSELNQLERNLNNFSLPARREAILRLARMITNGAITPPRPKPICNIHAHTFFSYNAYGYSPSFQAWLAKREGIQVMGIIDFDTLDGVDEFLWACDQLDVRGTVNLETRIFLPEFAGDEITSPHEPGVTYHILAGFTSGQIPPEAQLLIADLRARLEKRNLRIVTILNDVLAPLSIDFSRDVLPLSAGGTPTERHILDAYVRAGADILNDPVLFWADKLETQPGEIAAVYPQSPKFKTLIRQKLIKAGGVAYQQPDAETYPPIDSIHRLADLCGALPTAAWVDGTSAGEQHEADLLEFLINKGAVALNIIPDRNWNIADPDEKTLKVQNLYAVVDLAKQLDLPIFVGTEMNKPGQKWVDSFQSPELAPLSQTFLEGAFFLYGHTLLSRRLGLGARSSWAADELPGRRAKNAFYSQVGRLLPNTPDVRTLIKALPANLSAKDLLKWLQDKTP